MGKNKDEILKRLAAASKTEGWLCALQDCNFNDPAKAYKQLIDKDEYKKIVTQKNPDAPELVPSSMDDFRDIANCYDYAFNDLDYIGQGSDPQESLVEGQIENTHGWTHGTKKSENFMNFVDDLVKGVQVDGAELLDPGKLKEVALEGHYLVAVYASPSKKIRDKEMYYNDGNCMDFHFVRQVKDGGWSHKLGYDEEDKPTTLDMAGHTITDPIKADMGGYKFVCYLSVPVNGLDVGEGPRYNNKDVHMTPEERRICDEEDPKQKSEIEYRKFRVQR